MVWHGWWSWWWVMLVMMLAILGGLMAFIVALSRNGPRWPPVGPDPAADAERILDERYARGEISDEEFEHRRAVLRGSEAGDRPAEHARSRR
jgi:putative membrane protein